jgi:hypothetical protein
MPAGFRLRLDEALGIMLVIFSKKWELDDAPNFSRGCRVVPDRFKPGRHIDGVS